MLDLWEFHLASSSAIKKCLLQKDTLMLRSFILLTFGDTPIKSFLESLT